MTDAPRVYWYGPVDKIGSNLAALPRVLFITPSSILVCQPSGGVTRTVLIEKLTEIVLVPPTVVRLLVAQEADLVISTQSPSDRSEMLDALLKAFHETCGQHAEIPVSEAAHLQTTHKMVSQSSPSASSSPVNMSQSTIPGETRARAGNSPGSSAGGPVGIRSILSRLDDETPTGPRAASPPSMSSAWQSTVQSGSSTRGGLKSASTPIPPSLASTRQSPVGRENHRLDLPPEGSVSSLQQQIESQRRIIDQLQQESDTTSSVHVLKRDLDQARSLVADLQSALRSQEGAFSEMVRANEALHASETVRATLEAQLQAVRDEVHSLKTDLSRRDQAEAEWRKRVASLEEHHRGEIQAVRDAFAKYDEQVTAYVDQLKSEHDATLRELLKQKDALLIRQGELQSRVEQLEFERKQAQLQRSAVAGNIWRPQLSASLADLHDQSREASSEELRSALLAKLNRYAESASRNLALVPPYDSENAPSSSAKHPRDDGSAAQLKSAPRKSSPASGRLRDRSIL